MGAHRVQKVATYESNKMNQLGLFTRIMVGFVLGIAAGLIFGESNKAGISWNYIDPSADYGSCTIGAFGF